MLGVNGESALRYSACEMMLEATSSLNCCFKYLCSRRIIIMIKKNIMIQPDQSIKLPSAKPGNPPINAPKLL